MSIDSNLPDQDLPDGGREDSPAWTGRDVHADELSNDWLDAALRAVALPGGFLERMSVLARRVEADWRDSHGRLATPG